MSCTRSALSGKCLVDTNLLVYSVSPLEGPKSVRATEVIELLVSAGRCATTPQVVAEFFSSTTRSRPGRPALFTPVQAMVWSHDWLTYAHCINLDLSTAQLAVTAAARHQMHIYDAQIWAAASVHGVPTIITEDTPGGRSRLEGIRYINPFTRSFKLASLGV